MEVANEVIEQATWQPPEITNTEELEEALREHAELEFSLKDELGQFRALTNLAEKYKYMASQIEERVRRNQGFIADRIERFWATEAAFTGKRQYKGAFGTVRLTRRRHQAEVVDKDAFLEWARENAPDLIVQETKTTEKIDTAMIDTRVFATSEVPPGVQMRGEDSCSIKPDCDGLTHRGEGRQ